MSVKIYSATVDGDGVTVEATSATALVALCTVDDGSNSFCSAALLDVSEWTEVTRKTKTGRLCRSLACRDLQRDPRRHCT